MSRNGSGVYNLPPANYPAVSATTITAANRNAIDADIAIALTNSIAVNGESVVTADIPFGNNKLTGVKDGTLAKDAANVSQIQNSNAILLASVAGTDTITASLSPALTAYANGQIFTLIPANSNTGAVTININGLGAKSITKNGSTALVAGDLVAGVTYSLQYDGTRFQKIAGSDYAKSGANSDITSLTALTAITAGAVTVAADDKVLIQDTSAGDALKTVTAQSIANLGGMPTGAIIDFAGVSAPSGFLACPLVATNVSRTTYAALFAAIGTTWGAGDGSTTFGLPFFPADYATVQANGNVGTQTVGQNLAHNHPVNATASGTLGAGWFSSGPYSAATSNTTATSSTGGSANLAAGVRVLKCVKI